MGPNWFPVGKLGVSMIRAVTLDCAETLVHVRWSPGSFALDCAHELGIALDPATAKGIYESLFVARRLEYEQVNLTRDVDQCIEWWKRLTNDWFEKMELGPAPVDEIMAASNRLLYHPPDRYFKLFDDVIPALNALSERGIRLAVLSNWDYSLHRVIRAHGIESKFELIIASLEEGVEKPDARLFEIARDRLNLPAEQVLHVGDNPSDDLEGALGAGFRAVLIDRGTDTMSLDSIPSLTLIPSWIDLYGSD